MRADLGVHDRENRVTCGDQSPSLTDILSQVVQALVDQGHSVPEITQAMRYVADITDMIDRIYGDRM